MDDTIRGVIQAIHDHRGRAALAITGAGSAALHWLLGVPGASRTVLDAVVPYSRGALIDYLGWEPAQYVSPETAVALAAAAYGRAGHFAEDEGSLLGVSCTAAIVSDRPKKGDHRAQVAVWDGAAVSVYSLVMDKGRRDRQGEEQMVSRLIIRALADGLKIEPSLSMETVAGEQVAITRREVGDLLERLLGGAVDMLTYYGPDALVDGDPVRGAILPGSFNPLHEGHLRLAKVAGEMLDKPVLFELSVQNVDKPPLTALQIKARLRQFERLGERVVLTRQPLYAHKADLLPGATFITGYDNARRLVDARYYDDDQEQMTAALEHIRAQGCDFLIAGRLIDGVFRTLDDIDIPDGFGDLFNRIPESVFRVDLSSTVLREQGEEVT